MGTLSAGALLQSRYRLDVELGRGGMGAVYRAHDLLLDRDVAVKVVGGSQESAEGRAHLLREAQAAARLNHPNIVAVYDVGEAEATAFIVMELAEGRTLFEYKPESLTSTLTIARQICLALDHAHTHGIIHRDLKPENVILTPNGVAGAAVTAAPVATATALTAKLTDFGLALDVSRLTPSSPLLVGTVFYLAPEQALGEPVDGRADLYSLGVLLYELTTGVLPFTGDDPLAVITQHLHTPPAPPRVHNPDLPAPLDALIVQLLSKQPDDRPGSADEVRRVLEVLENLQRLDATQPMVVAAPSPPSQSNLPLQLTSFIGREREIAEVQRLLAETRLLMLSGSAGTGKTRLALRAAANVLDAFPDGVWLIELASQSNPALLPQSVASVMGVREEPGFPLTKTLAEALHHKTVLLILDNCEHLIDACARLAEVLLRACPNLKLLATSREALGIPGELAFRVPSLSIPDLSRPTLAALKQSESGQLFVERALAVKPDFALTEANATVVAQICQRLDGVALALELAAARVKTLTVEQIAARLDDRFRLLTGGSRTALPRQQTLRAMIDWSWELLSEPERVLLRRLAVFWGGWTLEAAEKVASDKVTSETASVTRPLSPDAVLDLLTHLVDKSLVLVEEEEGEARYGLLETIRQYAGQRLLEAGEAEVRQVRSRHLAFFADWAEAAEPALRGLDQLVWLARLELEHDNLRAALKWSLSPEAIETGVRLAGSLARFWYLHGYWSEGREWLENVLSQLGRGAALSNLAQRAKAKALYGRAWLLDESGADIPLYEESLQLCRELGDEWGAAFCLRGIAAAHINLGSHELAGPHLNESLALFEKLEEAWGIGLANFNLGWLKYGRGNSAQAEAHWEAALKYFRRSGDRWGIAVAVSTLGFLARLHGDYHRAAASSEESLQLFRVLGDKAGMATSLGRLGQIALRWGDYQQAIALIQNGLLLRRERGDTNGMAFAFSLLGLAAGYQGDFTRAIAWLEEGLALRVDLDWSSDSIYTLDYLALVHYWQGHFDPAMLRWQEALDLHRKLADHTGLGLALNGLGMVALSRNNFAQAREQLEESLRLFRATNEYRYVAIGLNSLGRLAGAQGERERARAFFKESLALRKDAGERHGIAECLEGLAGVAGQPLHAARLFCAAEALRAAIGAPIPPVESEEHERAVAAVRAALGEGAFATAWAEGRAMMIDQAIQFALMDSDE
ncbi:MAG: protein kinase domain-containing protein [Anaerolineales bacterium]